MREVIRKAEKEIAGKLVEHVLAYDASGNEVLRKLGTKDGISLTDQEAASLHATTVLHNHPDEQRPSGAWIRDIPPSIDDDLSVLLETGPKEIRVITGQYRFSVKAEPDARFGRWQDRQRDVENNWRRQFAKIMKERFDSLERQVALGKMTTAQRDIALEEAISENAHRAWRAVAKGSRLTYRRERRK
jgi:hypothetical protein